jgi:UDP-galactose transporter B1
MNYPEIWWDLILYSVASPIATHFIFLMITTYGSLQCSIITTSRKFLTILVNTLGYHRELSMIQIYSISAVFVGIVLEQYGSYIEKNESKKKENEKVKSD